MAAKKKTKRKTTRKTTTKKKPVKRTTRKAPQSKKLFRSKRNRVLGGVCGGIGEYLGVDPVLIRLLWVIGTFIYGFGLLAYILAWIIIPERK